MGCALSSKVAAPETQPEVPDAVRRFTPESVELEATATFMAFQSPRQKRCLEASPVRPGFSPLKPSPSLSAKSAKSASSARSQSQSLRDLRSTSPFRLSVFSATERSLPGDSAFLWGSPQVLLQRFQQPTVPAGGESLYDSDSEGEITRSSPLRLKSTHSSAFGSSVSFLKWSASKRCFDAKIASAGRWAHPPERTVAAVAAVASAVGLPERTPEPPEVGAEETPDEQKRLQKLAARASEVRELLRPKMNSEDDLQQVTDQVSRAIHFIAESLPHAAETLGVQPVGLVFQALLLRAGLGRGNLTQVELERILGEGKVEKLAWAARELCELLRVKVEDDGDLSLALKVLEDCKRFFRALAFVAEGRGASSFHLLEVLINIET